MLLTRCHLCMQYPRPVFVGADLSKVLLKDALQGTGFDPAKPSLFICEGLLYYLPQVTLSLSSIIMHIHFVQSCLIGTFWAG